MDNIRDDASPPPGAPTRRFGGLVQKLRHAGLRPTRQRLALASLLFERGHQHVCAEALYDEAQGAHIPVSLATVYNTLHQFTAAGLLREVAVAPGRFYFDTNLSDHHHFYFEATGVLEDIAGGHVVLARLPTPPEGTSIARVDVVVRIAGTARV